MSSPTDHPAPPGPTAVETGPGRWAGDEDIALGGMLTPTARTGELPARDNHLIIWFAQGTLTLRSDREPLPQVGANHPVILAASVAYEYETTAERFTLLRIREGYLRDVAEGEGIRLPSAVRFAQQDDAVVALAPLRTLLRDVSGRLVDPTTAPAVRAAINHRIAQVVLATFPVAPERAAPGLPAPVRAAVEFIRNHLAGPITIEDIAAAANRSSRALQEAFRARLGLSPITFLRNERLDTARRALETGEPAGVRDVALTVGFRHLGRFSAAYAARFGESPSTTLRHSRTRTRTPSN